LSLWEQSEYSLNGLDANLSNWGNAWELNKRADGSNLRWMIPCDHRNFRPDAIQQIVITWPVGVQKQGGRPSRSHCRTIFSGCSACIRSQSLLLCHDKEKRSERTGQYRIFSPLA
jgi:hypothetical protein